ncbi:MAG: DUF2911 domain-containing protein [Gemmatimonadota bacterium]
MPIRVLSLLALSLLAARLEAQSYGFISRLGRDTISVERVTRSATRVVIDQVERAPRVIQRHAEMALAPDGTVRDLTVDISTPNPLGNDPRTIHVTAAFGRDSVRIAHKTDAGTRNVTLSNSGYLTMPWSTYMFGSYELLAAAAAKRKGNPLPIRQFIPGRLMLDEGALRKRGNVWEITTTALAGFGQIHMDPQGRMSSYSGAKTTYLVEVERLASAPDVAAITQRFAAAEKSSPVVGMLSVRGAAQSKVGKATITVDYGRPMARGRVLVGGIIPYGEVWRTGANAATQFTTTAAIKLEGLELAPGTYTLWTLPSRAGVQLIVNKQFGQWGTNYDPAQDLGHIPLTVGTNKVPVERFTITVEPATKNSGNLALEWGTFRWTVPIVVK